MWGGGWGVLGGRSERGEEETSLDVALLHLHTHTNTRTYTCMHERRGEEKEGEKERGEKEEDYQRREGE